MQDQIPDIREGHKLADRVHAYLRTGILSGQLAEGERVVEADLARQLQISRSPIREAIKRLEQEGLVVVDRLRVVVRDVPRSEIDDLFWIRSALEGLAALQATPRLTATDLEHLEHLCDAMQSAAGQGDAVALADLGNQFHGVFATASGNHKLGEMLRSIKEYVDRYRAVSAARPGRGQETITEHQQILAAFRARDAAAAEQLVRRHVLGAKRALLDDVRPAAEPVGVTRR